MKYPEQIAETAEYVRSRGIDEVDVAVILGTGLGRQFVDSMEISVEITYEEIPHFPEATVEFHHGKLVYGTIGKKQVLAFNGRFHYYEGYTMREVTYPVRVAKGLNAGYLLISNAAGCMNMDWEKGDLMLIDDHINLQGVSPLAGENFEELGPRFTDMSEPYSKRLNSLVQVTAEELNIVLREGVYAGVTGPQLETRAEYRYIRQIGADVVGMSTVPEVIVAKHAHLPCAAVSVITDMCDPDDLHPIDIEDIIKTAGQSEKVLTALFLQVIEGSDTEKP